MDILSYLDCRVKSTVLKEDNEEEWLRTRSTGIGGSDVGSICDVNPFSSARVVYLKKTGQTEDLEDFSEAAKERMMFGNLLEDIVAQEYARRSGNKIAVSPATMQHKTIDWALANVDRLIVDDEGKPYGILECKTTSEYNNDIWLNGDLPVSYLYQLLWYLWITGLKYGALACLVGGNKFYMYEVVYNEELMNNYVIPTVTNFWENHVLKLVAPDLQGSDADSNLVKSKYLDVNIGEEIEMSEPVYNDLANTVREQKAIIKAAEKTCKAAQNKIKEKLKHSEIGNTLDNRIKWSPRASKIIDSTKLKKEYPDVYADVVKITKFRVMSIKEVKLD